MSENLLVLDDGNVSEIAPVVDVFLLRFLSSCGPPEVTKRHLIVQDSKFENDIESH